MKQRMFVLAVITSLAASFISLGSLQTLSPVLGQAAISDEWGVLIYFPESEDPVQIKDLEGASAGQGSHMGQLLCSKACNHKTQLQLNGVEYQYRFETRKVLDPVAGLVIVAGTGTLSSGSQKERFSFTASFEDNRDGTVRVTYSASRSDASFDIPETPGIFAFFSKP